MVRVTGEMCAIEVRIKFESAMSKQTFFWINYFLDKNEQRKKTSYAPNCLPYTWDAAFDLVPWKLREILTGFSL